MNISLKVLIVIFLTFCVSIISATIINVPGDQPTIQDGINVAVDSDTVLVQPGTYIENINYNGKNITVASLFLTTQDTIYISPTIIDGNQDGSVVVFNGGEDSTAVLCGFTITNGLASGNWPACCGGGIYCFDNSSPKLERLTISGNSATYGGGISCSFSSPSLINLTISNNSANYSGGGIHCRNNSSPSLINITITGNNDSLDIAEFVILKVETVETGDALFIIESTTGCVLERGWLLVNLLEHEVVVTAFFDLVEGPANFFNTRANLDILNCGNFIVIGGDRCNLAILEINDPIGMFEHGGDVGGYEFLTVTMTEHQGRAHASGYNRAGVER